jgi:hypothetical protein
LKMGSPDTPRIGTLSGDKIGGAAAGSGPGVYQHQFKTLDFDGIAVGNLSVAIVPDFLKDKYGATALTGTRIVSRTANDEFPDMLIGMNVLKHLHIYIAYGEGKLYATPAGVPTAPTSEATSDKTATDQH